MDGIFSYYLCDVFTREAFGGNPLAVFPKATGLGPGKMQKIAKELNLSETTFVFPPDDETNDVKLRIFTPQKELPMAGHPTVGSAFILLLHQILKPKNEHFLLCEEGVGTIRVDFEWELKKPGLITMTQPLPEFGECIEEVEEISKILTIDPDDIDRRMPIQNVSCGLPLWIIPLKNLTAVKNAQVRVDLLRRFFTTYACKELLIFCTETENSEFDVHCRFFAPQFGIPEDPATGSAAGPLGAYLAKYHHKTAGKHIIRAEQGYEIGRPSQLSTHIECNAEGIKSVKVGGFSVWMGEGKIYL